MPWLLVSSIAFLCCSFLTVTGAFIQQNSAVPIPSPTSPRSTTNRSIPKPCTGWRIHSSSSGTSWRHRRSRLQYHRSWSQNSTVLPCTSCSQWGRMSRRHRHRHRAQLWAQKAPFGCRTFRSRLGTRRRSTDSGPGCRSWVHSDRRMSSSGRSSRWLRHRGRLRRLGRGRRRR